MKKRFFGFLALLCPFLSGFGQRAASRPVYPLTVGEPVPNLRFSSLVNYATPTARLSDFSDKVLILDLMTSRCGSCVEHLHYWDSLQTRYADRLQILPVTYESSSVINAFFKTPFGKGLRFPFVTNDTLIRQLFPHQFISHLVWIYRGKVQAITEGEYVKAANIETLLQGKPLHLPLKKDIGFYDPAAPLLTANGETILPENAPQFRYYSSLIPYMDGFSFGQYEFDDTARAVHRSTIINCGIDYLYRYALGLKVNFPAALVRYEVKDSSRFFKKSGYWSQWYQTAYFGYQSSLPLHLPDSLRRQRLLTDLDDFLGLQGRLEQRTVRCIILRRDSTNEQAPLPKPGKEAIQVQGFPYMHNSEKGATPLFVEMDPKDNWYVPRPTDFEDVPALQALLRPYGILVTTEQRELTMLVIREAGFVRPAQPAAGATSYR